MTRFALQPRWLLWHLLLVAVLISFGWLGRWQLNAYEDKGPKGSPDSRPVVALARVTGPGDRLDAADLGRRVRISGTYDGGRTLLVPGRPRPGADGAGADGLLVVSPLRTADGVLPVVRGWVRSASDRAARTPTGPVTVTGLVQRSEDGPPPGAPVDVPAGRLPYVATVTLLDALPYRPAELYDGFLALRGERPSPAARPVPVPAQAPPSGGVGRWRNLGYALQWWVFAGAAGFFWWVVLRRAWQERPAPGPGGGLPSLVAPRRTT